MAGTRYSSMGPSQHERTLLPRSIWKNICLVFYTNTVYLGARLCMIYCFYITAGALHVCSEIFSFMILSSKSQLRHLILWQLWRRITNNMGDINIIVVVIVVIVAITIIIVVMVIVAVFFIGVVVVITINTNNNNTPPPPPLPPSSEFNNSIWSHVALTYGYLLTQILSI